VSPSMVCNGNATKRLNSPVTPERNRRGDLDGETQ